MSSYPNRPKFFAHRFVRVLTKTCASQEIGCEAFCLLTIIAHTEDAKHYSGPVTYWNEQLMPICGFGGKDRLVRARKKAVDAGWLHYEPGSKAKAARYWTLIPDKFSQLDDAPTDEADDEYDDGCRPETGRQPGRQADGIQDGIRDTFNPVPNPSGASASSCHGSCRFSNEDFQVAEFIWSLILELQPKRKPPNLEDWANDIRLMRERDGRTHEGIRDLFRWANADSFWKTNILSPGKLRKKFDDLLLKQQFNGNGHADVAGSQRFDPNSECLGVRDGF